MKKIALKTTYYVEMPDLKALQAKFVIAFDSESEVPLREAVDLSNAIVKAARKEGFEVEANSMSIISDGVIYQL